MSARMILARRGMESAFTTFIAEVLRSEGLSVADAEKLRGALIKIAPELVSAVSSVRLASDPQTHTQPAAAQRITRPREPISSSSCPTSFRAGILYEDGRPRT